MTQSLDSQNDMILNYMQKGHSITPMEALKMFGSFRLGARIYDLRRRGHSIYRAWETDGIRKRWARYALVKQAPVKRKA